MAKRRRKENKKFNLYQFVENNRTHLLRAFWVFVAILCLVFGYTQGYPIVAAGEFERGILVGLAWGFGSFFAIAFSFYLNRKLKGL